MPDMWRKHWAPLSGPALELRAWTGGQGSAYGSAKGRSEGPPLARGGYSMSDYKEPMEFQGNEHLYTGDQTGQTEQCVVCQNENPGTQPCRGDMTFFVCQTCSMNDEFVDWLAWSLKNALPGEFL